MNDLSDQETEAALEILAEELGVERSQLTPDARLVEDLNIDSLMLIELALTLEDRFDLLIPDERLEKVRTVGDVLELLGETLRR